MSLVTVFDLPVALHGLAVYRLGQCIWCAACRGALVVPAYCKASWLSSPAAVPVSAQDWRIHVRADPLKVDVSPFTSPNYW